MARLRFTEVGRTYKPTISITAQGLISINKGAYHRFGVRDYEYAVLFFDDEIKEIGVMLVHSADETGAAKVRHRKYGADISAKGFLDYFGIKYGGKRMRFQKAYLDHENGNPIIVFRLEEIEERTDESETRKL